MNFLKRAVTILCILCMLSAQTLLFASVSAETSAPVIEVASVNAEPDEGKNIEVTISLSNNPGITSMLLTVVFGDGLSLKEVNDSDVLGSTMHNPSLKSPYYLSWANDTATADYTSNGTIATLIFDYTGEKSGKYTTPITVSYDFENFDIMNKDSESVYFDVENGDFSICHHTNVDIVEAVEPTCTESGLTEGKVCKDCKKVLASREKVSALVHKYSTEWTIDKEVSCTEDGSKSRHCIRCDAKIDDVVIPAKGHKAVAIEAKDATCTEAGLTEGEICSVCNKILVAQEEISALGHKYTSTITKEVTCTEKGEKVFTCTACGDSYTEEIEPTGHKYTSATTKEATCTEKGEKVFTCSKCGYSYTEEIEPKGHKYTSKITKEATCTEKGEKVFTCSKCGYSYTEEIEPKGHKYTSKITKEATCTQKGEKVFTCSKCDDTYTKEVAALGHKSVVDKAVSATCTKTGLSEGKHCSVCNEILVAQTVVKVKEHKTALKNVKKATYFEKGYSGDKYCTVCKKIISKGKALPKLILKAPKITVKASKSQLKVTYQKASGATGYQVKYKIGKNTYIKTYKSAQSASKVYKKLKAGTYKVYVRAFAKKSGKTAYSAWSKVKKIKVK